MSENTLAKIYILWKVDAEAYEGDTHSFISAHRTKGGAKKALDDIGMEAFNSQKHFHPDYTPKERYDLTVSKYEITQKDLND